MTEDNHMPDDLPFNPEDVVPDDYESMTREELIECIKAHDAHHEEHHERERAVVAERDRCHARLEIDHVYDANGERREIPLAERGNQPDGIYCRDETIRLQDEEIDRLRAVAAEMKAALATVTDYETAEERNASYAACNAALAALDQVQTPAPIDVEALKREVLKEYGGNGTVERSRLEDMEWVIDHLHAQGYLSAKLPKIDGLDEALDYYGPDNAGEMRLFDTTGEDFTRQFKALIAAARAYRERME